MVLNKLLSGRLIFTICTAIVFMVGSLNKLFPADKIAEIIMLVIIFYFNRTDRKGEK